MRVDELWEGIRTWKRHLRNLFPAKLFCLSQIFFTSFVTSDKLVKAIRWKSYSPMVVSCISSIRFSSLDGLVLDSTSYKGHSTICHRSTNIRKNILFSINHSVQLTKYSDEEHYR
ncbi:hypothetical protein T4C_3229 [Trichinella pseudospiralis]|nr:hypothetical protein T4C_3229 [Trichinella pseudospiralis]